MGTAEPLLPPYARFFEEVIARGPVLFGLLGVVYEAIAWLFLLGRGYRVKEGIALCIAQLLVITPLGIWAMENPVSALLLRREYDRSLPRMLLSAIGGPR